MSDPDAVTEGTLLGGRVRYRQFAHGHRTGFEPVLLAAAVPAKPGERVLEAGTGAGAGLLCLAARVPEVSALGVERDAPTAALARVNLASNGFASCHAVPADVAALPFATETFHHAFANPPWHDARGSTSAHARRRLAHAATAETLPTWTAALKAILKPGGSLSFILPASQLDNAVANLEAVSFGNILMILLHPREGKPASQVILTARLNAAASPIRQTKLILHEGYGLTPAVQSILRLGNKLPEIG